ncbi:MAG TPA: bacterioferritin [Candidatus Acidoferrales bacterium]|nr:bacterioferritin [Candidatus Acidoferrales bacterium]
MKGNPQVIKALSDVLRKELTGINQYFLHAKMCENWGYQALHERVWKESLEEMKHAEELVERIVFLESVPNLGAYDKILVGETVKQQLENDLALEQAALETLKTGIKTCLEANDNASRELLEHILIEEEKHVEWIEAQLHQIKEIGYENYLAQQIHKKG